ncbi:hypothetical protein BC829DRAFT_415367 [Chytridium lagenaria]|nr:hypothetical protein BC829DRAFT_415367 [Chytridium lagenaria]
MDPSPASASSRLEYTLPPTTSAPSDSHTPIDTMLLMTPTRTDMTDFIPISSHATQDTNMTQPTSPALHTPSPFTPATSTTTNNATTLLRRNSFTSIPTLTPPPSISTHRSLSHQTPPRTHQSPPYPSLDTAPSSSLRRMSLSQQDSSTPISRFFQKPSDVGLPLKPSRTAPAALSSGMQWWKRFATPVKRGVEIKVLAGEVMGEPKGVAVAAENALVERRVGFADVDVDEETALELAIAASLEDRAIDDSLEYIAVDETGIGEVDSASEASASEHDRKQSSTTLTPTPLPSKRRSLWLEKGKGVPFTSSISYTVFGSLPDIIITPPHTPFTLDSIPAEVWLRIACYLPDPSLLSRTCRAARAMLDAEHHTPPTTLLRRSKP